MPQFTNTFACTRFANDDAFFDPSKDRHLIFSVSRYALLALVAFCFTAFPQESRAQSIIRDSEIENIFRAYASPLFEAGNLPPEAIQIRLINSDIINAFVTRGNRMYFHTGLILKADHAGQVIGVLAHEAGHIHAGHAVVFSDSIEAAGQASLLATLLGVAAGVASGNPELGLAVALGGQGVATRQLLSYSRGQESAADLFAMRTLEETGQSARGLYEFFNKLAGQELLYTTNQDPYVRTHPLNRTRMESVDNHLRSSNYSDVPVDPQFQDWHLRMVAKLYGYLKTQTATLQKYPESDQSIYGRYARSIAYYRRGQLDVAIPMVDDLIEEEPDNPYFPELKAQMLFENGRIREAITAYRQTVSMLPRDALILGAFGHALVEANDPALMPETERVLNTSLQMDPNNVFAWDLLARAYANNGDEELSSYAAAEKALLLGQFGDVMRYSDRAEPGIDQGTPMWYRLQDLKATAAVYMEQIRERRR